MQVQRINVSLSEGNEADLEVNREQLFNDADTGLAQVQLQVIDDEQKDQEADSA